MLLSSVLGMRAAGTWNTERGTNTLDSGAPFYGTYRCADGEYVAVGAAERYFFDRLLDTLGVADDPRAAGDRLDRRRWDAMKECIAEAFAARSRAEWMAVFDDVDACVTPVLSLDEVAGHPHNRARGTFLDIEGVVHPAAAPRFSRTRPAAPRPPGAPGRDSADVLRAAGYSHQQITGFVERHVVAFPDRTAASVIDRTGGRTPC